MALPRTPPSAIIRALRQEVQFGCPVPDCRSPLLTFHRVEHHNAAEAGAYSRERLRDLKQQSHRAPVRGQFPWSERELLVRMGGAYSGGISVPLALAGKPVIHLQRGDDGLLRLSATLFSDEGEKVMEVVDNAFILASSGFHDVQVNTGGTRVSVWVAARRTGFDLSFKRITAEELAEQLASSGFRSAVIRSAARRSPAVSAPKSWTRVADRGVPQ